MDNQSEARLQEIEPGLSKIIHDLYNLMSAQGIEFRITQGLRSWQQQADLYAQGRTATGQIVTNAQPGYSWHEFGMAVDFVPMDGENCVWDVEEPAWAKIRDAGEAMGLVSGSRWQHPDRPHFQSTGKFPVTPNDEVRQIFRDAGMQEIWKQAFA